MGYRDPVSPHLAAATEQRVVADAAVVAAVAQQMREFVRKQQQQQQQGSMLGLSVVETAGGVTSPGPSGSLQVTSLVAAITLALTLICRRLDVFWKPPLSHLLLMHQAHTLCQHAFHNTHTHARTRTHTHAHARTQASFPSPHSPSHRLSHPTHPHRATSTGPWHCRPSWWGTQPLEASPPPYLPMSHCCCGAQQCLQSS